MTRATTTSSAVMQVLTKVFLIGWIVDGLMGLILWVIPGKFLSWLGWAPIDPIISRLLGAALLALAWASFLGWRSRSEAQVAVIIQIQAAFATLGAIAVLRHLLVARWPFMVWLLFVVLAAWAIVWLVYLVRGRGAAS